MKDEHITDAEASSAHERRNRVTPQTQPKIEMNNLDKLPAERLRELLEDYIRDKKQVGKNLGLLTGDQICHRFQLRAIFTLQFENRGMKAALAKIHERMQGPANNRRFMQIAGPARECLNLAKPFLPNTPAQPPQAG